MTALVPSPNVKYRIQSVDFPLKYLELLDSSIPSTGTDNVSNVSLRTTKETDRQYWTFEKVSGDIYYVRNVANTKHCLYFYSKGYSVYSGPSSTSAKVNITAKDDGTYQLSFNHSAVDYYFNANVTAIVNATSSQSNLDSQKWQLVPVTPQPVRNYPLETGVYRIRNLNGQSLLTMPDDNQVDKYIYVRSQVDQSSYQRWAVTLQPSGTYVIQNAGNDKYLGCSATISVVEDGLVGVSTTPEWELQSVGGFAWSLHLPKTTFSIGFADYQVEDGDKVSLVTSDSASSQIWFMEKYVPIGEDKIYAKRELAEGNYLIQSAHDQTIYMNYSSDSSRIFPGKGDKSKFKLNYIDANSALFTLTYVTTTTPPPIIADLGGYLGLNEGGTQFVLLEEDAGDGGYVICRPDAGRPRKVVSGRTTTNLKRSVFVIENKTNENLQKWKFISSK